MPNRIIRESIRTSESINQLKPLEEILFYRLIVSCDDYGRYDGRAAIIKGTCFPLKNVTVKDIENALASLSTVCMIDLYEVDGKPYIQLTNWEQYQTVRSKKSKYPDISKGHINESAHICKHLQSDVPVIQSNTKSLSESYSGTEYDIGDTRLEEAMNDFIEFRKKIKSPMTDRAIQLAIKKLKKLSNSVDEQVEIINQSIMNGWKGLFELKRNNTRRKISEVDQW